MEYDPIKKHLGKIFKRNVFTLRLFYFILDVLFLRAWYIHREIKRIALSFNKTDRITVLDAGSGFGQYSWYIARKYKSWIIKGIDIKEKEVKECSEFFSKAGLNNVNFDIEDLTEFSEPQAYNIILSVDVLEHILDDVKVMENAYKSLKSGGMLLISTPSDQGGSDIHSEDDTSFISEHVRDGYSIKDIHEKLEKVGFNKVNAKYSYGKFGSLSWRLSIKYPVSMLNFSKFFFFLLPIYYLLFFPLCFWLNILDVNVKNSKGTGLIVVARKK
ncbi:MAG: class I SAM-dependent methyltransferase [Bacteroidetes bacterium]|nr:class I SAM-dependent methyltransferase [Bacteroidota bacterium]